MAKQKGIIPIEGTIGNITFYKTKDGYLVKEKSGVSADRLASDPAFARTRENIAEFGRAGKAAKLFRTAFRAASLNIADYRVMSRIIQLMSKIVRLDATNPRGQRGVLDAETVLLQGFEFNRNAHFENTVYAPFSVTTDKGTGDISLSVPAFSAAERITVPSGATHFRLVMAGAAINFEQNTYAVETKYSGYLQADEQEIAALELSCTLSGIQQEPLLVGFGIEFFQEVNNTQYSLKNGAFNALAIVKVDA